MTDIETAHLKLVSRFLEPAENAEAEFAPLRVTAIAIGIPPDSASNTEALIIFLDTAASACEETDIRNDATALVKPFLPVILRSGPFEGLQAAPGASIAPLDLARYNIPPIAVGTLGLIAADASRKQYLMSSNHVLANNGRTLTGTRIFDPGPVDDATGGSAIATFTGYVPLLPPPWPLGAGSGVPASGAAQVLASPLALALSWPVQTAPVVPNVVPNTVDCAWAQLTSSLTTLPAQITLPTTPVATGTRVTKRGRTTGDTNSTIRFRRWCGFVDFTFGTYYLVDQLGTWNQTGTDPVAAPGDSGSLAVEQGAMVGVDQVGVGLLCARGFQYDSLGDFEGSVTLINRLETIEQKMQSALGPVTFYGA